MPGFSNWTVWSFAFKSILSQPTSSFAFAKSAGSGIRFSLRAARLLHAYFPRMTSVTVSPPIIRRADPRDALLLAALAATTFAETFLAANDPRDIAAYSAAAFGDAIQRAELLDARNIVLFAAQGGEVIGYVMLRRDDAPTCVPAGETLEIARLYVVRQAIGQGIGAALMRAGLAEAESLGCDVVWLGVWEHNARAIAFYRAWGFRDVGSQGFQLGADLQTDRLMARRVVESA